MSRPPTHGAKHLSAGKCRIITAHAAVDLIEEIDTGGRSSRAAYTHLLETAARFATTPHADLPEEETTA